MDNSEGENVPEIQTLTSRVRDLSHSVDLWNESMLWGLALAAVATVFVVLATRIVVTRTGQLSEAQSLLSDAKDRQLQSDLKVKDVEIKNLGTDAVARAKEADVRIAGAQQAAAEANLRAEQERLERIKLEEALSPRLFRAQEEAIEKLRAFSGTAVTLEYFADPECKRTAEQIAWVLNPAGWLITSRANPDPSPLFREGVIVGRIAEGGGVVPVSDPKFFGPSAGAALIDELNKTGIDATTSLGFGPGGPSVFVHVAVKPSPEQKKIMKHIADIEKSVLQKKDPTVPMDALKKALGRGQTGNRLILPNR
jgi:hypothetical protein